MKLIVDFDDVLFKTSKLKETFFSVLKRHGVQNAEEQYHFERKNERPFSLRLFLRRVCQEEGIQNDDLLYEEVMSVCKDLKDDELSEVLKENGRENCYIVTSGNEEFQKDKIVRSGVGVLAREVIIVPGSKKEIVEALCHQFNDEEVIFIDDKNKFFLDIDVEVCRNLKTVLYNEHGLENLRAEMEERSEQLKAIRPQKGDIPSLKMR